MPLCSSDTTNGFNPLTRRPLQRKVVVVGDGGCGKLVLCFLDLKFKRKESPNIAYLVSEPTVFENYVQDVHLDDQIVELSLWDTAGQEDFDQLRSLSYAETHVVILCFSVDNPVSLDNVESKWIREVLENCPGVKVLLVALKCDLREDKDVTERLARYGRSPVQYEEGLMMARQIRASRYLECSSKHNRGVDQVFFEAARCAVSTGNKRNKNTSCIVM